MNVTTLSVIVACLVLLDVALVAGYIVRRFLAFRGQRVIVCPESKQPAGVELDAWLAATSVVGVDPTLRLKSCSRWPERQGCGQGCLAQIEDSPDGTLVRNIIQAWYRDKRCACCKRVIGEIAWHDSMPALRAPDGTLRECAGIAPAEIPAMLETHQAICWNCNLVEGFRHEHPELVTERIQTPLREQAIH